MGPQDSGGDTSKSPWELHRFPAPSPGEPKLAGEGKAILLLGQCWEPWGPPTPPLHRCSQSHNCKFWLHLRCRGPSPPGLTFCHRDSREASDEQAATNQQLPTWPWCRSWELMPSTKRRGSSHMSCGEAKRGRHRQRGDSPASPGRLGAPCVADQFLQLQLPLGAA